MRVLSCNIEKGDPEIDYIESEGRENQEKQTPNDVRCELRKTRDHNSALGFV